MTSPGANYIDPADINNPGSPYWWLRRLTERLMSRQSLYDLREDYALGNHPLPNGDRRYVRALRDFQQKAKTNYIELVQKSTVEKMRVKGFRFGAEGKADKDASRIWAANDMDYQAPIAINMGAIFGFTYGMVSPPDEPGGEPIVTIEDPRQCEVERDPRRINKSIAALKLFVDPTIGTVVAVLYLPDFVYEFQGSKETPLNHIVEGLSRTERVASTMSSFILASVTPNELGEVPLIRGDWEPSFGEAGRAEGEVAWDIQDRINKTVLDRLVISNSQAYRQRWVSGVKQPAATPAGTKARPPWDPGADMLWLSTASETKFGDFEEADIRQILEAVRDDTGDLAAITQTPSTALTNKMVNVSGDTLTQAQAGHIGKVKMRMDAMGFFFEKLQKLAFKYKSDERANEVYVETMWYPPETRSVTEMADYIAKGAASGIPLQILMDRAGFTPDEIEFAVAEAERLKKEAEAREDQVLDKQLSAKAQTQTNSSGRATQ